MSGAVPKVWYLLVMVCIVGEILIIFPFSSKAVEELAFSMIESGSLPPDAVFSLISCHEAG